MPLVPIARYATLLNVVCINDGPDDKRRGHGTLTKGHQTWFGEDSVPVIPDLAGLATTAQRQQGGPDGPCQSLTIQQGDAGRAPRAPSYTPPGRAS